MPSISRLVVPEDVADKIREHGLTVWQVVRAVAAYGREARWDVHPVHGGRVIILAETDEEPPRLLFVALRPIDVERGVWSCITAFVPDREDYGR